MQIAVIPHDRDNCEWLCARLESAGFRVRQFERLQDLVSNRCQGYTAIVVDMAMQCPSAQDYVHPLRRGGVIAPILVLNARDNWRERVECIDAGADDHLVKPVRTEEIVARLRAIIRRKAGSATNQIVQGDITLDLDRRCAWLDGQCLDLTRNEFRLLRIFLFSPASVLTPQEISAELYGEEDPPSSNNAIETLVARLRRKLGAQRIKTIRGMGYRYEHVGVALRDLG